MTSELHTQLDRSGILSDVDRYFSEKVRAHGATPAGVDWNGIPAQHLRFEALLKVVTDPQAEYSMLDYGCGYGSMYDWMRSAASRFRYTGYDVSADMISRARETHAHDDAEWLADESVLGEYDYVVESGIFNIRFDHSDAEWLQYILHTMDWMHEHSRRGFACNLLTSFSDEDHRRPDLYYANPMELFAHCKTQYSRNVALLHDYDLYDFTLIVRK